MKKYISILLVVIVFFVIVPKKSDAMELSKFDYSQGNKEIGMCIDVTGGCTSGLRSGIFNTEYKNKIRIDASKQVIPKNKITYICGEGTSYDAVKQDIHNKHNYNIDGNVGYKDGILSGRISACGDKNSGLFSNDSFSEYKMYSYSSIIYRTHEVYSSAELYDSGVCERQDAYDKGFLTDLKKLPIRNHSTNRSAYYEFFNKYGTHIITAGFYGAYSERTYSYTAKEYTLSKITFDEVSSCIESNFGKIATSSNENFDFESNTRKNLNKCFGIEMKLDKINSIGGVDGEFAFSNSQAYSSWKKSVGTTGPAVLLEIADGGLLPIWDSIPKEYSSIVGTMKCMFEHYVNYNQHIVERKLPEYAKISLSTDIIIVDDKGSSNKKINVSFSNLLNGNEFDEYVNAGYNSICFTLDIDMRRIIDGYADIKVFYLSDGLQNIKIIIEKKGKDIDLADLPSGNNTYASKSFVNTVKINDLKNNGFNDEILVLFSAHGSGDDK